MAKKRKCRYSAEELYIHEQAVKLRKMTDKQLVTAFNNAKNTSQDKVYTNNTGSIQELLNKLSDGKCKGIKSEIVHKLTEFCYESGLIE